MSSLTRSHRGKDLHIFLLAQLLEIKRFALVSVAMLSKYASVILEHQVVYWMRPLNN